MHMEDTIEYKITHTEEFILNNTKFNIDFIPTFEEYQLLVEKGHTQDSTFNIGVPPLFILNIPDDTDKNAIAQIKALTQDDRIDGLDVMFDRLFESNTTDSYDEYKIYYMAFLLLSNGIEVNLQGQNYRNKLNNKKKVIRSYEEQLNGKPIGKL